VGEVRGPIAVLAREIDRVRRPAARTNSGWIGLGGRDVVLRIHSLASIQQVVRDRTIMVDTSPKRQRTGRGIAAGTQPAGQEGLSQHGNAWISRAPQPSRSASSPRGR